ncbi:hypothetical protein EC968_008382 [Mortierella alpina]|nr:hypothetical protein EC968_008382 [Mortierella alpina]
MASSRDGNNINNNGDVSSAATATRAVPGSKSGSGPKSGTGSGSGTLQALRPNVVDRYWNDIAEHFREPGFSTFDKEKSRQVIRDPEFMRKLLLAVITDRPGQGDILPSVIAKSSCDFFVSLDKTGKTEFLKLLARDFGVLQEDVVKAAQQYTDSAMKEPESKALLRAEQLLRHAVVPGHNKFFDRVSRLPGGLKFLIDMRQDLLITQYEAVHKFKDFYDLKRRVGPGRRVFALMNKSLPAEPLVFVQVALVKDLSSNVQDILNDPSPGHANPAETVEFPQIETFSTLSPIPGFRKWIGQCQNLGQKLLLPQEEDVVRQLGYGRGEGDTEAQYILLEKRRHLALDPVANFHLRNGACAHRLNWLGDTSSKGMEESFGMMINYLYALDHIEMNNQQYLQDGTISVSSRDPGFKSALSNSEAVVDTHGREPEKPHQGQGQLMHLGGVRFRLLDIATT